MSPPSCDPGPRIQETLRLRHSWSCSDTWYPSHALSLISATGSTLFLPVLRVFLGSLTVPLPKSDPSSDTDNGFVFYDSVLDPTTPSLVPHLNSLNPKVLTRWYCRWSVHTGDVWTLHRPDLIPCLSVYVSSNLSESLFYLNL